MGQPRRSPLFGAVVLAGASLTQGACGGAETRSPNTSDAATSTDPPKDAGTTTDAALEAGSDAGACPPGSERPVPPCAIIR